MIRVDDIRRYDRLPPVEKLLTLLFAMVGKDRATLLRLDYESQSPRVRGWYAVAGELYELVPPPAHLWPDLVAICWRHTRLPPAHRRPWWRRLSRGVPFPSTPVTGVFPVAFAGVRIDFDVVFFRGPTGEHIWFQRQPTTDVAAAVGLFRALAARHGESGMIPIELPDQ